MTSSLAGSGVELGSSRTQRSMSAVVRGKSESRAEHEAKEGRKQELWSADVELE